MIKAVGSLRLRFHVNIRTIGDAVLIELQLDGGPFIAGLHHVVVVYPEFCDGKRDALIGVGYCCAFAVCAVFIRHRIALGHCNFCCAIAQRSALGVLLGQIVPAVACRGRHGYDIAGVHIGAAASADLQLNLNGGLNFGQVISRPNLVGGEIYKFVCVFDKNAVFNLAVAGRGIVVAVGVRLFHRVNIGMSVAVGLRHIFPGGEAYCRSKRHFLGAAFNLYIIAVEGEPDSGLGEVRGGKYPFFKGHNRDKFLPVGIEHIAAGNGVVHNHGLPGFI